MFNVVELYSDVYVWDG